MKGISKIIRPICISLVGFVPSVSTVAQLPPSIESYSRTSRDSEVGTRGVFTEEVGSKSSTAAAASLYVASAETYSCDIRSIVSACEGDPKKLFEFVRNHVRFTPYFGFRKGADLTWVTRAGNDADQAELLVTLLRAAGYSSAQYEYGELTVPLPEARAWFGADNDVALDWLCGSAGYYKNLDTTAGTFLVEQIWVSVSIGGTVHRMHPGYKTFTVNSGMDLAAASGYTHSAFLTSGGGTATPTDIQGVNDANVSTYLTGRATSLVETIRTSAPNASMEDVVGGRVINTGEIGSLADAFPSFSVSNNFAFAEPRTDMSDKLDVAVAIPDGGGGLIPRAGFLGRATRSIGGQRISISFDPGNSRAEVWLDDTLLSQEPLPVSSSQLTLFLKIDHPYFDATGADRTRAVTIDRAGTYVVIDDLNGYDSPVVRARRKTKLAEYERQGFGVDSREIRSESLHLLGLGLMGQYEQAVELQSRISRFEPILHHSLGVIRQEAAFSVDVPILTSYIPRDGTDAKFYNNVRVAAVMGSALEHGVIEQHYPSLSAVSTVQYMRRNNSNGGKTYLATSANYPVISTDPEFIAGWPESFRNSVFPSILTSGHSLSIPQNGQQLIDQLTGNGFFHFHEGTVGAIINTMGYTLKGGFPTTVGRVDPGQNPETTEGTEGPDSQENPESTEPVDLFTGAYVSDQEDLALGGTGSRGLSFRRTYSSAVHDSPSDMGRGWNHSCGSYLSNYTNGGLFFGRGTPEQAACAITGLYAMNDLLLTESTSALGWVVSSITGGWVIDRLDMNAVDVTAGRKNYTFTLHPNGTSFISGAGITAQLARDLNGLYRIEERFGATTYFNANNRVSSYVDADGKALTYSYNNGKLQSVSDCYGRTLTFSYFGAGTSQGLLQSVTDSTERVVTYTYTPAGYLETVTDVENGVTHFDHDAAGRLWKMYNQRDELVIENLFDEFGRVFQQVAEGDPAQTWQFAFTGLRNVQIDPLGHRVTLLFDQKERNTGTIDALGNRTRSEYDGQNHLISVTDAKSQTTTYQYDGRHNLRFVTNANLHNQEMVYDAQGRLDYILDEAGKKTDFTYDAEHHLTGIMDAVLRTTTYQYYGSGPFDGLLHNIIEHNGDTTSFTYDANGHIDLITRPDNSTVDTTFNARGDQTYTKITSAGDPNIHEVTMTFDKRRLMLTSRDALNFGVTNAYDVCGRLESQTDRFGRSTNQTYSPWSRKEAVTFPNGGSIHYQNGPSGLQNSARNALNQTTQCGYDDANRLTNITDAANQVTELGYDANGNRSSFLNTRVKTWSWTHNAIDVVETLTSPSNRVWDSSFNERELLETFTKPSLQATSFLYHDDQRLRPNDGFGRDGRLHLRFKGTIR
jgi:YD repeat-containing protein